MRTTQAKWRDMRGLAGWLALVLAVSWIGSRVTLGAVGDWYAQLARPEFAPPDWVFGPVWTLLYILMAVAAWRIWRRDGFAGAPWALGLFLVQLALNLLWSIVFFGLQQIGLALVEIGVLWLAIVATLVLFWRRDRLAGALLLPYLAWVSFAAVLNYGFWVLN